MKNIKLLFLTILGVISISSLNATNNNCSPEPKSYECAPCGCEAPKCPTISAYNYPARVDVCGSSDIFVTGSFIYWESIEQGLYLGLLQSAPGADFRQEAVNITCEYDVGFKAGLGYNFSYDDWSASIEYTRFHTTNNFSKSLPSWVNLQGAYWFDLTSSTPADTFTSKWVVELDMLDLEVGRTGYMGKKFTFRPFVGLKGGWLDQSFRTTFVYPTVETISNSSTDSWLIGPRGGIFTKFLFENGFNVFAKAAACLAYQEFSKMVQSFNNLSIDDNKMITPIFEFLLGINWGSYFYKNNYHFDLSFGYEIQNYLNQNKMKVNRVLQQNANSTAGHLAFHGLTVSAQLDF